MHLLKLKKQNVRKGVCSSCQTIQTITRLSPLNAPEETNDIFARGDIEAVVIGNHEAYGRRCPGSYTEPETLVSS